MRTGPLNKRVRIQRRVETQNEFKETLISYQDMDGGEVWAAIEPLSGRDYFAAQQLSSDVSTKIRIRHRDDVNRKMRVLYERVAGSPTTTVVYEIDNVLRPNENRREIWLMCREVDTEGFRADGSNG